MPDPEPSPSDTTSCWGDFELSEDAWMHLRIGQLQLWAQRRASDWRLVLERGTDPLAPDQQVRNPSSPPSVALAGRTTRFGTESPSRTLRIAPSTPDRTVVTRPFEPFFLPPGDEVTIYVTVPLWIRLSYRDKGTERRLMELPAFRPSDTWVGPPTREGELAYASPIACFLSLGDLPVRPHRSVTAVRIKNRSDAALPLERIHIPVPRLSLFAAGDGKLWTQDVILVRRGVSDFAELRLSNDPPGHAGPSTRLAGPRSSASGAIIRAFGSWLR